MDDPLEDFRDSRLAACEGAVFVPETLHKVAKPCGRSPQGAECSRVKRTAQCILAPSTAQGGKPCRGSPQGAECPSVIHCTVYSRPNTAEGGKTPSRYSSGCRREHCTVYSSAKHCTGWKNPVQVLHWVQTAHVCCSTPTVWIY